MATKTLRTACTMNCYSGCPIDVDVEDGKIIELRGSHYYPEAMGKLCLKGMSYPRLINSPERLKTPLIRKNGTLTPSTWEEAMDLIEKNLRKIQETPESLMFYKGSGNLGGSMEKLAFSFLYQFGGYTTYSGGLCDAAQDTVINSMFGSEQYGSISEIENSKLIILWGKNPTFTNMHSMHYIHQALDKGAKLVAIDPIKNESSDRAALHISPIGGTDSLLALALCKITLERGLEDKAFIKDHIHGMPEFTAYLNTLSMQYICTETGLAEAEIYALADLIKEIPDFSLILGKGLQRHQNGGHTCRSIAALAAICGIVGKKSAGLHVSTFMSHPPKWPYFPQAPKDRIRTSVPVARVPVDIPKLDPPVKAMWVERANPMVSAPGTTEMKSFIESLEFVVVADPFLTETAKLADVVLPVAMFMERDDLFFSYGQNYLQYRQKVLDPPDGCRSEPDIWRELGDRFGFDKKYFPKDDKEALSEVLKASGYSETLEDMIDTPVKLPVWSDVAWSDLKFNTPSGKIELLCNTLAEKWNCDPLPIYQKAPLEGGGSLHLITPHPQNRINSQFIQDDWLDGEGDDTVHINHTDAALHRIKTGDTVKIYNNRGSFLAKATVGQKVRIGTVAISSGQANLNVLLPPTATDMGGGASFHSVTCDIERVIL